MRYVGLFQKIDVKTTILKAYFELIRQAD